MKAKNWIVCLSVCALTGTAWGQYPDLRLPQTGRDTNQVTQTRDQEHSSKFSRSKDLIGANVKDAQGNKLGDIDELLINPQSGETFASIGVSGTRYAIVPIQALKVTPARGAFRNAEVTLNSSKQSLESGPTLARDEWQKLDSPSFTQSIYSHYNVQQPSAMGGTDDSSMGGASGSSSLSQTNHQARPQR